MREKKVNQASLKIACVPCSQSESVRGRLGGRFWARACILFFAFILRSAYAFYAYNHTFKEYKTEGQQVSALDPDGYNRLGVALIERGELSLTPGRLETSREPFYPLLLAAVHFFFGLSPIVGITLNVLIGVLCCWMTYAVTLSVFQNERVGLFSLLLAAFFPEWIYFSATMFREPLIILLSLIWILLWQKYSSSRNGWAYAGMGTAFGLLCLTRSPFIPIGGAFALLAASKIKLKDWARTIGIFLLCAFVLEGIWTYRNERILKRWVAGASMGGSVMYLSLLYNYSRPDIPLEYPLGAGKDPVISVVLARHLTLDQAEPIFYQSCLKILIHHPLVFWDAFIHKVMKLWRPYPNPGWKYPHSLFALSSLSLIGLFSGGGIMLLGLWGSVLAWRNGYPIGFLILFPMLMSVVYGLFWAVMRYHTTLMVGVIPQAAYALDALLSRKES